MSGTRLTPKQVLDLIPQRDPFRFIDDILELDDDHIVGTYRFRPDADFYRGHFPGNPVTPGVILIESLAQVGIVALGCWAGTRRKESKGSDYFLASKSLKSANLTKMCSVVLRTGGLPQMEQCGSIRSVVA